MTVDIDTTIFVGFLIINLAVGLFYSRGITTITEYAIGSRNFSTVSITTTIIATCIGGGIFSTALTESYKQGLYFILPIICGVFLAVFFTGYFLAPRMIGFFGSLSVAEAMGKIYGKPVRVITAICGILLSIGTVALQFRVGGSIMQLFFDIPVSSAMILSSIVVIIYSSFGGIKAVVFTDILQFCIFTAVLPLLSIAIWQTSSVDMKEAFLSLQNNPLFDYKEVFNVSNSRFLPFIFLFIFFIIPGLDPAFFQRVSMSSGVSQAKKSFMIAAWVIAAITALVCFTGVILLFDNPNLDANNLLPHIINKYTYTGLKGLTGIGIMAIIMSTADSYINSAACLLSNDIIQPLRQKSIRPENQVLIVRIVSFIVSSVALIFACESSSMLQLLVKTFSFMAPIVSVPLLLAIFGFCSDTKVVLTGMAAGAITVILWPIFGNPEINEGVIGMLANLITFCVAHWAFKVKKRSDRIEHSKALNLLKIQRERSYNNFFYNIKNINFTAFCERNLCKQEKWGVIIGVFAMICVYSTMYSTAIKTQVYYARLFTVIYHSTLVFSSILIIYSILPAKFKNKKLIAIFSMIAIPYILVFIPTTLLIISNFGQFQLMMFLLNITLFALLMRWQVTLSMLILGTYLSIKFCTLIMNNDGSGLIDQWAQYKIVYAILFISAIIIAFLKPRQEEQELSTEIIEHLSHEVHDQKLETGKAIDLKNKFLRNLQHETNTPLTGVYSMSQALDELYDKLSDEQRKAAIHTIHTSSERLISYFSNMVDLSKLRNLGYELKITKVNLSRLADYTLTKCQKLYIAQDAQEDRDFVLAIEPDITVECDEYYIGKAIENIITNAIQYCKKGQIIITLKKTVNENPEQEQNNIIFSVEDSGIGIPKEDFHKIFDSFTTSAKTDTPAGGRGVGLALAKTAIELHRGNITCTSDGHSGCCFTLTIPASRASFNA